jgi:MHS family proline/betaine transporter-like MFS transporter
MKTVEQRSLTREQKEAVELLSIGTFLEYFDCAT